MAMKEELAYLEGYIEGLDITEDTKEGKAILAILDCLESIVEDVDELDADVEDLNTLGEELDEDLGALEEYVFGDLCDCDCDCDEDDDDFNFDFGDCCFVDDDDDDDDDDCCCCGEHCDE